MVGTTKNTDDEIRFILDLYRQGIKPKEIARQCDLKFKSRTRSPQSVTYVVNKYKKDSNFKLEPAPAEPTYKSVTSNKTMYSSHMINQQQVQHLPPGLAQQFDPSSYMNNLDHQTVSHPASNNPPSIHSAVQGESFDTGLGLSRHRQPFHMDNHLQRYPTLSPPNTPGPVQQTVSNLIQKQKNQISLNQPRKQHAATNNPQSQNANTTCSPQHQHQIPDSMHSSRHHPSQNYTQYQQQDPTTVRPPMDHPLAMNNHQYNQIPVQAHSSVRQSQKKSSQKTAHDGEIPPPPSPLSYINRPYQPQSGTPLTIFTRPPEFRPEYHRHKPPPQKLGPPTVVFFRRPKEGKAGLTRDLWKHRETDPVDLTGWNVTFPSYGPYPTPQDSVIVRMWIPSYEKGFFGIPKNEDSIPGLRAILASNFEERGLEDVDELVNFESPRPPQPMPQSGNMPIDCTSPGSTCNPLNNPHQMSSSTIGTFPLSQVTAATSILTATPSEIAISQPRMSDSNAGYASPSELTPNPAYVNHLPVANNSTVNETHGYTSPRFPTLDSKLVSTKHFPVVNNPNPNPKPGYPPYRPTAPIPTPPPRKETIGAAPSGSLTLPTFDPNFDSTQWAALPPHLHTPNPDFKSKPSMGPKSKKGKKFEFSGSGFDAPASDPVCKLNAEKTGIITKGASIKNNPELYIGAARWRSQIAMNKAAIEAVASSAAKPVPTSSIPAQGATSKKRNFDDVEPSDTQEGVTENGKRHKASNAAVVSSASTPPQQDDIENAYAQEGESGKRHKASDLALPISTAVSSPQSVTTLSTSDSLSPPISTCLNTPQPMPQTVNINANKRKRGRILDQDIDAREEATKRRKENDEYSTNSTNGDTDTYTSQKTAVELQYLDAEDTKGHSHNGAVKARWVETFTDIMLPSSKTQQIIDQQTLAPEPETEQEKKDREKEFDAMFVAPAVDTSYPGVETENWFEEELARMPDFDVEEWTKVYDGAEPVDGDIAQFLASW